MALAYISPYLLHVLFSRKMQAGSQKAIGFSLVDVKDFPLQICLPAAIIRDTVGQTNVEQSLVNLSVFRSWKSQSRFSWLAIHSMWPKMKQCDSKTLKTNIQTR